MSAFWEHVPSLGHQQLQNRLWQFDPHYLIMGHRYALWSGFSGQYSIGGQPSCASPVSVLGLQRGQPGSTMGSEENKRLLGTSLEK